MVAAEGEFQRGIAPDPEISGPRAIPSAHFAFGKRDHEVPRLPRPGLGLLDLRLLDVSTPTLRPFLPTLDATRIRI